MPFLLFPQTFKLFSNMSNFIVYNSWRRFIFLSSSLSSLFHHLQSETKSYDFEVTSEKKNILTSTIFLIIHPQIFVTCWRCYIELAMIHFAQMMSYQTFCQHDKVPNIHFAFFLKEILLLPNFPKKSDILPKLHFAHTTFCKNYILPNF